jgi:flagellar M-ring protein FliF
VLSKTADNGGENGMAPDMLEYQQNLERRLELRAQALLDRALGMGNSMVQVTAAVDYTQRERMEETYDPNTTAVRSEQATTEKGGIAGAGGVPGVQSNINNEQAGASFIPTSRTEETVNYEISKVVSKQVDPVGTIKNLSVAVLVADRPSAPADGAGDDAPTYEPRDAKELAAIEKMVSRALGIDARRGDQIAVISRPFETSFSDEPYVKPSIWNRVYQMVPMVKYALLCLAAGLFYFLLIRPLLKAAWSNSIKPSNSSSPKWPACPAVRHPRKRPSVSPGGGRPNRMTRHRLSRPGSRTVNRIRPWWMKRLYRLNLPVPVMAKDAPWI